jgi:hypothetical protein
MLWAESRISASVAKGADKIESPGLSSGTPTVVDGGERINKNVCVYVSIALVRKAFMSGVGDGSCIGQYS